MNKLRAMLQRGQVEEKQRTLPEQPCDMCGGTGKTSIYPGVYYTTCSKVNETLEKGYRAAGMLDEAVEVDCNTCSGTGKLPDYLKPGYWK